ncbi:MAG TPA: glycosyl hydrolase, partial [Prolixibacteraceae bacterium]|nr:glycosyl hydrolase [Prolixibacteraceae bacterium]
LETIRPEVLSKIKQLVQEGAVVLGPAPKRSPSLQNQPQSDEQVAAMAKELWGDVDGINLKTRQVGKGWIMNGLSMEEAFEKISCPPDCKLPEDKSIHYGHRTTGNGEIYFITNQTGKIQEITPEFRVTGMQPECWEATTGYTRVLPAYVQKEKTTAVPLRLEPFESVFIVFRYKEGNATSADMETNYPAPVRLAELKGPWTVQFDAAMRGPEQPVVFETLKDWTTHAGEQIKYYSGTAVYQMVFSLKDKPSDQRIFIDLGDLTAMAKVTLNGKYTGGVWTKPYRLDITEWVKQGENDLKVEVVNTWLNRLIGDSRLPAGQRPTWCPVNPYKPGDPLQPSGLLGPVEVVGYHYRLN